MALRPTFRPEQIDIVVRFIQDFFRQAGKELAVVGMSGGLDSSVTAYLCVRALGPDRVRALFLKDELSSKEDERDVEALAKALGITMETVNITPMVEAFREAMVIDDQKALGNVRARCRMIAWYTVSNMQDALVVGTGNKSEVLIGFFSKFGDAGVDLLPMGDLYKTQVREMARHLGVPEKVIDKVPSPGLWRGQTDEGELGISYDDLDRILLGLELEMKPQEVSDRTGLSLEQVLHVEEMIRRSIHKRKTPLIPKVGVRTVGLDWRE